MDRVAHLLFALAAFVGLSAGDLSAKAAPERPTLIVISIDGFRADYIDRGLTPTLSALAKTGVHAVAMRPSFPSVTEPNHYTLMTGLCPDHHGIVDNTMIDPTMPGLNFGGPHEKGMDNDPRWWNGAVPLWVTAQRRGLKTASSFWPGDEAVVHGVAPTYLQAYPKPVPVLMPMETQIDMVLGWMSLAAAQRPALIRLHLDPVDTVGHVLGPDSSGLRPSISKVDAMLAKLIAGLKARDLDDKVNIIIVSDHGMTTVSPDRVILLDDVIDLKNATVPAMLAAAGINPAPGHEAEIAAALLKPHDHMTCWRKADIPTRLHYGTNSRVAAILCLADLGWTVATRAGLAAIPITLRGNHGYNPAEPTMAALFVAHGPAFKSGVTLPAFDNIDVYSLLTKVMGIRPEPNDGNIKALAAGLKP